MARQQRAALWLADHPDWVQSDRLPCAAERRGGVGLSTSEIVVRTMPGRVLVRRVRWLGENLGRILLGWKVEEAGTAVGWG